jgi:hypothetical protein
MSRTALLSIWLSAAFLAGCASIKEAEERDEVLAAPINCVAAKGDLRVLEGETNYVAGVKAAGGTTVTPASIAYGYGPAGGFTGEGPVPAPGEQYNVELEIDRYQEAVNRKIADIKSKCGLWFECVLAVLTAPTGRRHLNF